MDIEKSLERARKPIPMNCPICGEECFSPADKLSIGLYGKCGLHIEENSHEERNFFKILEQI